jgi:capsular polysaccharide biosynthesis protein
VQTELDLRDYYHIIRKRIWLIVAIVLISTIVTGIVSMYVLQPIYQASTKLIVNKSDEAIGGSQLDLNTVNLNIRLIDTYKEIIKTPAIMDVVAQEHPEWGLSSEQLVNKVQVSSVNNTQVMTLVVQDPSHDRAVDIVNAVSAVFVNEIPSLMKVDNVSLLSKAKETEAPTPVKPRPALNAAIGFVVSLMIAVGIVFLKEYFDDSIKTDEDVSRYLGLPTLALIPKVKEEDLIERHASVVGREAGESYRASVN